MRDVRDKFPHPHWRPEGKRRWAGLADLWARAPLESSFNVTQAIDPYSFEIHLAIRYGMAENNKGT